MSETSDGSSSREEQAGLPDWPGQYTAHLNARYARSKDLPLRCPCCGCKTLAKRFDFEICEVCYWEDDGQDDGDIDWCRGGPNGSLSLRQARANYLKFEACEESMIENVRPLDQKKRL